MTEQRQNFAVDSVFEREELSSMHVACIIALIGAPRPNNHSDLNWNYFWGSDEESSQDIPTSSQDGTIPQEDNEYLIPGEFEGKTFIPDLSVFFNDNED